MLDHPELLAACNGREIFFEHTDGRDRVRDRVLGGHHQHGRADMAGDAVCTEAEIDYFFDLIGHVFPDVAVSPGRIVYSSRACIPCRSTMPPSPASVSRDSPDPTPRRVRRRRRRIQPRRRRMYLLPGPGPNTSDNDILAELSSEREEKKINGAGFPDTEDGVQRWIKAHVAAGRGAAGTTRLLAGFGTRAADVIAFPRREDQDQLLHSPSELSVRELEFMAQHEQNRAPDRRPDPPHTAGLPRPVTPRAARLKLPASCPVRARLGRAATRAWEISHVEEGGTPRLTGACGPQPGAPETRLA